MAEPDTSTHFKYYKLCHLKSAKRHLQHDNGLNVKFYTLTALDFSAWQGVYRFSSKFKSVYQYKKV